MSFTAALAAFTVGSVALPVYRLFGFVGKKAGFRVVRILLDVLFGCLVTGAVVIVAFAHNDGILQPYMLLGAAVGYWLNYQTLVLARVLIDKLRRKRYNRTV